MWWIAVTKILAHCKKDNDNDDGTGGNGGHLSIATHSNMAQACFRSVQFGLATWLDSHTINGHSDIIQKLLAKI